MRWLGAVSLLAGAVTGPPIPTAPVRSPAQQALDLYGAPAASRAGSPCAAGKAGEVVVCGSDDRRDRLPLPAERGVREGPRTAIGEPPRAAPAGLAQIRPAGAGLTLTVRGGKATVKGNGAP